MLTTYEREPIKMACRQPVYSLGVVATDSVPVCSHRVTMTCSNCNSEGHNKATCSTRKNYSTSIPKAKRCQCCGVYGRLIHRHHTRGRANNNPETMLDVCNSCHLECCHTGCFANVGIKPRVCRRNEKDCFWRQ